MLAKYPRCPRNASGRERSLPSPFKKSNPSPLGPQSFRFLSFPRGGRSRAGLRRLQRKPQRSQSGAQQRGGGGGQRQKTGSFVSRLLHLPGRQRLLLHSKRKKWRAALKGKREKNRATDMCRSSRGASLFLRATATAGREELLLTALGQRPRARTSKLSPWFALTKK